MAAGSEVTGRRPGPCGAGHRARVHAHQAARGRRGVFGARYSIVSPAAVCNDAETDASRRSLDTKVYKGLQGNVCPCPAAEPARVRAHSAQPRARTRPAAPGPAAVATGSQCQARRRRSRQAQRHPDLCVQARHTPQKSADPFINVSLDDQNHGTDVALRARFHGAEVYVGSNSSLAFSGNLFRRAGHEDAGTIAVGTVVVSDVSTTPHVFIPCR